MTVAVAATARPGLLGQLLRLYAAYPIPLLTISLVDLPLIALSNFASPPTDIYLLWAPVTLFIQAALVHAFARAASGGKPNAWESSRHVLARAWGIISVGVRYFGAVLLLSITVIGIPFAVRLAYRWVFGVQGVVLEDLSAPDAFGESIRLVDGRWRLVVSVFLLIISLTALVMALNVAIDYGPLSEAWLALAIPLSIASTPVAPGLLTLAYLQLRDEKGEALAPA